MLWAANYAHFPVTPLVKRDSLEFLFRTGCGRTAPGCHLFVSTFRHDAVREQRPQGLEIQEIWGHRLPPGLHRVWCGLWRHPRRGPRVKSVGQQHHPGIPDFWFHCGLLRFPQLHRLVVQVRHWLIGDSHRVSHTSECHSLMCCAVYLPMDYSMNNSLMPRRYVTLPTGPTMHINITHSESRKVLVPHIMEFIKVKCWMKATVEGFLAFVK